MKVDGVIFSEDLKKLIEYPKNRTDDKYHVPEGVEEIENNAFSHRFLKEIILPDSIKQIGKNAFAFKESKKDPYGVNINKVYIELPAKPIKIEEMAFTPFEYRKYPEGDRFQNYAIILKFRCKDTAIPVELLENWKVDEETQKLAEFIESEDIIRRKTLFYDIKTSEYKLFIGFYLALIYGDDIGVEYILQKKKTITEDSIYNTLFQYFDEKQSHTLGKNESNHRSSNGLDLSKWSIRNLTDGTYEIEKYKGKDTIIEIPNEVDGCLITSIGEQAFSALGNKWCNQIEKIVVTEGIKTIKKKAFENCINLNRIVLPNSLLEIEEGAFRFCSSLDNIKLPKGVTAIRKDTFMGCKGLKKIILGDTVSSIGAGAFSLCGSIEDILLPKGLKTIGNLAFSGCENLKHIQLPSELIEIGEGTFNSCRKLESIHIPSEAQIDFIISSPFVGCDKLKEILVNNDCLEYSSIDGVLFDKSGKVILCYPAGKGIEYSIPDGVEIIGKGCFDSCKKLSAVTIPDSVTRIDNNAFHSCNALKKIELSEKIEFIGDNALPVPNCTVYTPEGSLAEKYCLKKKIFVIISTTESEELTDTMSVDTVSEILADKTYSAAGFSEKEEAQIAKTVEMNGGKYLNNFAAELDYLIINENSEKETIKLKKAKLLIKKGQEISIITLAEFNAIIEKNTKNI